MTCLVGLGRSPVRAPHPGPQRLTRRRLPPVAPRIHPRARPTGADRV